MPSHKFFAEMSPALALEILEFTFANDKKHYRAVLEAVAQARHVRSIFLERQPRTERARMLIAHLGRPGQELIADNLIRNWLLTHHTVMLADFLTALGVAHTNGVVESLPETMNEAPLRAAVAALLAKYPEETVALYLRAFAEMNQTHWPHLETVLQDDPRLKLRGVSPASTT